MNTADMGVGVGLPRATSRVVENESTYDPKKLRSHSACSPPIKRCSFCVVVTRPLTIVTPACLSHSMISPAQVPHTARFFTNYLSGSSSPKRSARMPNVVLSPPGMLSSALSLT